MASYRLYAILVGCFLMAGDVAAQCCCCCGDVAFAGQATYEAQPTVQYRLIYETQYEKREIVTCRPVWQTEMRTHTYRVAKPVTETNTREYSCKVLRPVWKTINQQRQYVLRQPVTETVMQERKYWKYVPVKVMRTQYVDQGQYVNHTEQVPGNVRRRLRFRGRQYYTDSVTGQQKWQRAGLYWIPTQGRGSTHVKRVWVSKYVAQQIPKTTYQIQQDVKQVPVQVTKYVEKIVKQNEPRQVLNWKEETVTQPYQVTTTRYEYEEKTEKVPVRVCKMIKEKKIITIPRCVARWVPVKVTRMVPRSMPLSQRGPTRMSYNEEHRQLSLETKMSEKLQVLQTGTALRSPQYSVLQKVSGDIPEITSFPVIVDDGRLMTVSHDEEH